MKALTSSILSLFMGLQALPSLCGADGARLVRYSQTDVVSIRAKVRFSTLIVLPPDEEILDFTTGDKEFWIINGAHNLCYLHPAQPGSRSNLNLVTASGHVYSFLLTEVSSQSNSDPDLKVFVLPNDDANSAGTITPAKFVRASEAQAYKDELTQLEKHVSERIQQAKDQAQAEVSKYRAEYGGKLQFDYSYDSKVARPPFNISAIYHDDKFTYIKCGARETPTIYELKDKKPNLMNFDLHKDVYIIPKIVDEGWLVVGKKRMTFMRHG